MPMLGVISVSFVLMTPLPPRSTLFPYTTLFRSIRVGRLTNRSRQADDSRRITLTRSNPRTPIPPVPDRSGRRSEEHTSELQSQSNLVCRLLLGQKNCLPSQPRARDRLWQS